jgi:hypothetical protein
MAALYAGGITESIDMVGFQPGCPEMSAEQNIGK